MALFGCSGSDGAPGAAGPEGPEGPQGPPGAEAPSAPVGGGFLKVDEVHSVPLRWANFEVTEVEVGNPSVTLTVNVTHEGQPRNDFVVVDRAYAYIDNPEGYPFREGIDTDDVAVKANGSGEYTITVTMPEEWSESTDTTWLVNLVTPAVASGSADFPGVNIIASNTADGSHVRTMVSNQACINCHGDNIFTGPLGEATGNDRRSYHRTSYGVESCTICHTRDGRTNLVEYVHGIHSSGDMNQVNGKGSFDVARDVYSVGLPSSMDRCVSCHSDPDNAAKTDAIIGELSAHPVSYELCMSCHGGRPEGEEQHNWGNFGVDNTGTAESPIYALGVLQFNHANYNQDTNCAACHDGSVAPSTIGDYHPGFGGAFTPNDLAAQRGENIHLQINEVAAGGDGAAVAVTWQATNSVGALYDACNETASADSPIFFGMNINFVAMLGDDPIGGDNGQPPLGNNGVAINSGNTDCSGDVATTTFAWTDVSSALAGADKALAFFIGRPTVDGENAMPLLTSYPFMMADGAAAPRRVIVSDDKCLSCHSGGSMYAHGGNRFSTEVCIACHNPSATDAWRRDGTFGIDADGSFDGKDAESFSFAYNMHAIHAAGARSSLYAIYRGGRGSVTGYVYAYGGDDTVPDGWPVDADGNPVAYASGELLGDSANTTMYLKNVKYPRSLLDCNACHVGDSYDVPNQAKALALTMGTHGDGSDILAGPGTTSCLSCHKGAFPEENYITRAAEAHAFQNSWWPEDYTGTKEDILNFDRVETCVVCHGN